MAHTQLFAILANHLHTSCLLDSIAISIYITSSPLPPPPMAAITNWSRVRTIGRGATATVSLAVNTISGQFFAVKSTDISHAAFFRREKSILSALHSPYIISYLGSHIDAADSSHHLFLEYAPGGSLSDIIRSHGGRIDEPAIRQYAADVLHGLAYLHSNSVVHGDVKSSNVVVGSDGRAKIADFGCAQRRGFRPNGKEYLMGTPAFMAPEVARGEERDAAADVWAAACTVIEMATGGTPWSDGGDPMAALYRIGYTGDVPEIPGWLSEEGKAFLAKCLRRDPRERWTAEQLLMHPFVSSEMESKFKSTWISPRSILELEFWESKEEEEQSLQLSSPADWLMELIGRECFEPNWVSDEGWIIVRT